MRKDGREVGTQPVSQASPDKMKGLVREDKAELGRIFEQALFEDDFARSNERRGVYSSSPMHAATQEPAAAGSQVRFSSDVYRCAPQVRKTVPSRLELALGFKAEFGA